MPRQGRSFKRTAVDAVAAFFSSDGKVVYSGNYFEKVSGHAQYISRVALEDSSHVSERKYVRRIGFLLIWITYLLLLKERCYYFVPSTMH